MEKKTIRIGFIGAGSIGSLFGGCIASIQSEIYSIEVILFGREAHIKAINENGLVISKNEEIQRISNIESHKNPEYVEKRLLKESQRVFDFIFLTTKAYDLEIALSQYKSLINASKWIVILQNGLGNEDIVKKYFPKEKIIRAITTNGAFLKKPGHVIHTGLGITKLGFPFLNLQKQGENKPFDAISGAQLINEILNLAGLETTLTNDIIRDSWEKVLINIGINAIGTLTRLKNGELLKIEGLKRLMGDAIREAISVAKRKKIDLSKKDYVALTYEVAEKTLENKNSMLQDILKGKRTEIDFINGKIVEYAKEMKIHVPLNDALTQLIKGLEKISSEGF